MELCEVQAWSVTANDLYWLTVPEREQYKLAVTVTVNSCLHHRATMYLTDYCVPVSEVPSQQYIYDLPVVV